MQNAMRERQMSMQLAGAREMFYWLASFYGVATLGMLAGYVDLTSQSNAFFFFFRLNRLLFIQNISSLLIGSNPLANSS